MELHSRPVTTDRSTFMHVAAYFGNRTLILEMLRAYPDTIYAVNSDGSSPLHLAIAGGHLDVARWFLENFPDLLNLTESDGWTIAHTACFHGHFEIVKFLGAFHRPILCKADSDGLLPYDVCLDEPCKKVLEAILGRDQNIEQNSRDHTNENGKVGLNNLSLVNDDESILVVDGNSYVDAQLVMLETDLSGESEYGSICSGLDERINKSSSNRDDEPISNRMVACASLSEPCFERIDIGRTSYSTAIKDSRETSADVKANDCAKTEEGNKFPYENMPELANSQVPCAELTGLNHPCTELADVPGTDEEQKAGSQVQSLKAESSLPQRLYEAGDSASSLPQRLSEAENSASSFNRSSANVSDGWQQDTTTKEQESRWRSLLSSLKQGTDISRLQIPAEFLRSESTLERFQDVMQHGKFLEDIPSCATPISRMIAVIRFHISGGSCYLGTLSDPIDPTKLLW